MTGSRDAAAAGGDGAAAAAAKESGAPVPPGASSSVASASTGGGGGGGTVGGVPSRRQRATSGAAEAMRQVQHSADQAEQFFARLFRPKSVLCGRSFELSIDGVLFLCFPVTPKYRRRTEAMTTNMFNVVFVTKPPDDARPPGLRTDASGGDGDEEGDGDDGGAPRAAASGAVGIDADLSDDDTAAASGDGRRRARDGDAEGANGRHSAAAFAATYSAIAAKLAHALDHEERRCGYVTRETATMLDLKDDYSSGRLVAGSGVAGVEFGGAPGFDGSAGGMHATSDGALAFDDPLLVEACLRRSSLARALRRVYLDLAAGSAVHLMLNGWMPLSLSLRDQNPHPTVPIRPYNALLLLEDEATVLAAMPPDASPQLRELIRVATPLKSFHDLHALSGIPLAQILRLAAHLVYWDKARIVATITKHSTYKVAPSADIDPTGPLAHAFMNKFRHPLPEILAEFSLMKRLQKRLQALERGEETKEYIRMVIWLLRHDFLVQLHTHVYLVLPAEVALPAEPPAAGDAAGAAPGVWHSAGGRPFASFPEATQRYLRGLAADEAVLRTFATLVPYFDGRFSLEEMMWREGVVRPALVNVLREFRSVLVCCAHESKQ